MAQPVALGSTQTQRLTMTEDLTWMPAWRIRELIAKSEVSPVEVTEHFLGRIEALEPRLHAFRQIDAAGARDQARRAEQAVRAGEDLGPLHGIPVALKEHIPIKGLKTIAFGAATPSIAPHDDICTERLRKAGAVIVGSTVMPGMGNYAPASRVGLTSDLSRHPRNPWDETRVPGSSSAGGAAATAAAMLPMTIGSDGGGSTRLPASLCGVIGVHPSRGRIPYVNYDSPMLMTTVTFGPITRDARDAAVAMQALAGADGRDLICIQEPAPDYLGGLDRGVEGMRLAWTDDFGFADMYALGETPRVIETVRKAALSLAGQGASVEPVADVWEDFWTGYFTTNLVYLNVTPPPGTPKPTIEQVQAAFETRARNYQHFDDLLSKYDLLLSPTIQFTAFTVEGWDAAWNRDGANYPHGTFAPTYTSDTHMFNWLGWPAVSVPCGFVDGLPVGLQIIGRPRDEPKILRAAAAFMKANPLTRRPPVS